LHHVQVVAVEPFAHDPLPKIATKQVLPPAFAAASEIEE